MTLPMTVTVFSRYSVGEKTWFQPTVLPGVLYRPYTGQNLPSSGPELTGKTGTLWIPARGGRRSPGALAAAAQKDGLFTLLPGDYLIPGTVSDGEPILAPLGEQYPDARRILAVTARIYGTALDHWEVEIA